ncbi:hypothetical protein [Actinocorallia longicatena]|uniref:Uncharacterized protein n=1 Tax=Actinocorallia longicatena TaxID=111803 RepID=A0ABP6QE41_9ACTN
MKQLHRIILGTAVAGIALGAPAMAMADTYHGKATKSAGVGGAASTKVFSAVKNGGGDGGGGVFFGTHSEAAGPAGAASSSTVSAAH